MKGGHFTESVVDNAALAWLDAAGWQFGYGIDIAPENVRRPAHGLR